MIARAARDARDAARNESAKREREELDELERRDPRMAAVVKLRFFVGLDVAATAAALDVSTRTVGRAWIAARAWLRAELARREREGVGDGRG